MAVRRIRFGMLALVLFLGLLVGSTIGKVLAAVLPPGPVTTILVAGLDYVFGPHTLNFVVFTVTVGFSLDVNLMSVLGVLLMAQVLKWY